MKSIKAKYTEAVLSLARKLPWIFPKWLQFFAERYSDKELDSIKRIYEKEDLIEFGSLLDGNFRWKAVSVVVKIDHDELDLIRRWLNSNASPATYNPERDNAFFNNNYDSDGGSRDLGWIHFHKENRLNSLIRMEDDTKFCDSCYITFSKYSYGINYLSLYFFLKDSATEMVCDVDVREVKRYYAFESANPFSRSFRVIRHYDKINLVNELINKNIDYVCSDVICMSNKILNLWRIKKSDSELSLIADIYRDTNDPYFIEPKEVKGDKSNYVHFCRKDFNFFDEKISKDTSENFLSNYVVEKNKLDALFIKSKAMDSFEVFDNFAKNGLTFYDSHIFISMFIDVAKQQTRISEYANSALLKNSNKIEENYDILFESKNKLELLRENILAIQNSISHACSSSYVDSAMSIAKYRISLVDKLKESIDRRLSGLNSEMQVQNLRFNRRYSWLVGILVVIQILLAALTIEWDKFGYGTGNSKGMDSKKAQTIKPNTAMYFSRQTAECTVSDLAVRPGSF